MNKKDLWSLGKPAKEFPSDWLVVPVEDAVEFEKPCVLCKTNKAVHCWECSMDLVKKAREELYSTMNNLGLGHLKQMEDEQKAHKQEMEKQFNAMEIVIKENRKLANRIDELEDRLKEVQEE